MDGQEEAKMRTKRLDKGLQEEMTMARKRTNGGEDAEEVRTWEPRRSSSTVLVALTGAEGSRR